jgi:hypothetical protein
LSHQTKDARSVEVTPELVAHLRDKLESGNMSAEYIRELAVAATATDADAPSAVEKEGFLEHSNVVPLVPRSVNEAMNLADVAISLALYQAVGNSIEDFDWNTSSD